jgi:hypothetical protein
VTRASSGTVFCTVMVGPCCLVCSYKANFYSPRRVRTFGWSSANKSRRDCRKQLNFKPRSSPLVEVQVQLCIYGLSVR